MASAKLMLSFALFAFVEHLLYLISKVHWLFGRVALLEMPEHYSCSRSFQLNALFVTALLCMVLYICTEKKIPVYYAQYNINGFTWMWLPSAGSHFYLWHGVSLCLIAPPHHLSLSPLLFDFLPTVWLLLSWMELVEFMSLPGQALTLNHKTCPYC